MNKIILSLSAFTLLSCLSHFTHTNVNAETTNTVAYENNAYQICDVQSNIQNLYLGDSIYNYSLGHIRQSKSIRIKNPNSSTLTFYFRFNNSLYDYQYSQGEFRLAIFNEDDSYLYSFAEQISNLSELKDVIERAGGVFTYTEYEMFMEFDVSEGSDYLTIGGDEFESNYDHFSLLLGTEAMLIDRFMMYDGSTFNFNYSAPEYGLGSGSQHVYQNGSNIYYIVDYDNRLTLDEIKNGVIAYDYYDNCQITPTVELDEYTNAINDNKLGTFLVKLNAKDSASNSTTITLNFFIKDLTAPALKGNTNIEIHYTDLPSDNIIDLSNYISVYDNYDGDIELDEIYKSYSPKMFTSETINIALTDSSGNNSEEIITLSITDHIAPVIEGEDSIEVYQYEYASLEELLSNYNIYDDGSGIDTTTITSSNYSLTTPGTYEVEIKTTDKCSNVTTKSVSLSVKDGVGPVFFVNVTALELTTEEYQTANQVIEALMSNGSIQRTKYTKCEYITKAYQKNYNREGKYDTQIVCYSEDGTKDYYLVSIKVSEPKNSNFFTRFYNSMINFCKNLWNYFRTLFQKIKSLFIK